jgi:hypothetical protein
VSSPLWERHQGREYLATGSRWSSLRFTSIQNFPGVRMYQTVDEFIAAVEDALRNDFREIGSFGQSTVRDCTWDVRGATGWRADTQSSLNT